MNNLFHKDEKYVFGGFSLDVNIRFESTSGGAFSTIVDVYCDNNYVIFGAEADGLNVFHSWITDKKELIKYRKSKYSQSKMGDCYKQCKLFLQEGKKVLFSGTPCQIAGLKSFLQDIDVTHLLTIEVICEGVPSPLYIHKLDNHVMQKYGRGIALLDYRYTGKSCLGHGKWDFQCMKIITKHNSQSEGIDGSKKIIIDRWFNPFWYIWINHLMSRPACYECPFAREERVADISLGDLWGVHLFCPDLYGSNGGSSLVIANTKKGKAVVKKAQLRMHGRELKFEEAIKYQGPMRKHIVANLDRERFMEDLKSEMSFKEINKKWVHRPKIKLLLQKYVWGNRQKIAFWYFTKGKYNIK